MSALLDQLAAAESAATMSALEQYHGLVLQLAKGVEDLELSAVQKILADAGKTSLELSADVCQRRQRGEQQEQIRQAHADALERPDIEAKLAAADRELEAAHQRYVTVTRPLVLRLSEVNHALMAAEPIKAELRRTCTDADLLQRLETNQRMVQQSCAKRKHHGRTLQNVIALAQSAMNDPASAARCQAQVDELKVEQAELDRQLAELNAEADEIINRMVWS